MPPRKGQEKRKIDKTKWPKDILNLDEYFKALNLVYTFLSARKAVTVPFEVLAKSAKSHIRDIKDAEDYDVQMGTLIKALIPSSAEFKYKYRSQVFLDADVIDSDKDAKQIDIYRQYGTDYKSNEDMDPQWLMFDFVDEKLGRGNKISPPDPFDTTINGSSSSNSNSPASSDNETSNDARATKRRRRQPKEVTLRLASPAQIKAHIERRNNRFSQAVQKFLDWCVGERISDPFARLKQRAIDMHYYPLPAQIVDNPAGPNISTIPKDIPKERQSISNIMQQIESDGSFYVDQLVEGGQFHIAKNEAKYGLLKFRLSQDLIDALYHCRHVENFYIHQSKALNAINEGHNVIVSTSTSSGKSLIYQVPVLQALESDPASRAFFIFPTKALAQDQHKALVEMVNYMDNLRENDVSVRVYDGDTPREDRQAIRSEANVIFTNPDMLHMAILPEESSWRFFFQNLRYVVVDEIHAYNGLFGSNVAYIMRRLRRLCELVGNHDVVFISCSATIGDPKNHMKQLFGIDDVILVDEDGSPCGDKELLVWQPRLANPIDPTLGRISGTVETGELLIQLMLRGVKTIVFCRVRKHCESILKFVRTRLTEMGRKEFAQSGVMGYRGGYSPQDRRKIEKDMFEGRLMGIIATNALELGVDIGSLDAVLISGFPFSSASLKQQSGRAGRRNNDSLTVLIGEGGKNLSLIDEYYMQNPQEVFGPATSSYSQFSIDLDNPLILESHIQCAAFEAPIHLSTDEKIFGQRLNDIARQRLVRIDKEDEEMEKQRRNQQNGGDEEDGYFTCHEKYLPWPPSRALPVRGGSEEDKFAIIDVSNPKGPPIVIEEIEASRVTFTLYEGAIFLHQGYTYLVLDFQPDRAGEGGGFAKVKQVQVDWTTSQRDYSDVDPVETEMIRPIRFGSAKEPSRGRTFDVDEMPSMASFGTVRIKMCVFGYFKVDKSGRVLEAVEVVDSRPIIQNSHGFWIDVPKHALNLISEKNLHGAAAIHACEHLIIKNITRSSSNLFDVGTECKAPEKELLSIKTENLRLRPARLTFYDRVNGGRVSRSTSEESSSSSNNYNTGLTLRGFELVDQVLEDSLDMLMKCQCQWGCPRCVCNATCSEHNAVLSKPGAIIILSILLDKDIDMDSIPRGPEDNLIRYVGTDRGMMALLRASQENKDSSKLFPQTLTDPTPVRYADNVQFIGFLPRKYNKTNPVKIEDSE